MQCVNVSPLPLLKKRNIKKLSSTAPRQHTCVQCGCPLPINSITCTLSFALLRPHSLPIGSWKSQWLAGTERKTLLNTWRLTAYLTVPSIDLAPLLTGTQTHMVRGVCKADVTAWKHKFAKMKPSLLVATVGCLPVPGLSVLMTTDLPHRS